MPRGITSHRLRAAIPWALLAAGGVAAAVAYAPSLDAGFLFDDEAGIVGNPAVHGLAAWAEALPSKEAIAGRPLTELTFAIDAERAGLRPAAFHETSLALHLLATLLVFLLGRALAHGAGHPAATWIALAAALAFGLHPVQTESVAYVSQRAEVLGSLLAVASLLAALAADAAASRRRAALAGAGALVLFALAVSAKQIAVAVPFLVLLAVAAKAPAPPERARPWPRRLAIVLPMIALAAGQFAVFAGVIRGREDVGFSVPGLPPWTYLLTQARVLPLYLRLLLFPAGLNPDHDVAPSAGLLDPPSTLAGGLLVLGLAAAALAGLRWARGRGADRATAAAARLSALGLLWFLLLLAPTSSVVPLADVVAEHRVYLASFGIFLALAAAAGAALARLPAAWRAPAGAGAGGIVAAALVLALAARAEVWSSGLSLWTDAAAKSPGKARVQVNLGHVRHQRGDVDGAIEAYRRGIAIGGPGLVKPIVVHNLATALLARGRVEEARQTLFLLDPPTVETFVTMAFVEIEAGRLDAAAGWAARAAALAPGYPRAHEAVGRVAAARGDLLAARDAFRRSAMLLPDPAALLALGRAEAAAGDRDAACRALRRATAAPGNPWASRWAGGEAARLGCR